MLDRRSQLNCASLSLFSSSVPEQETAEPSNPTPPSPLDTAPTGYSIVPDNDGDDAISSTDEEIVTEQPSEER